MFSCKPCQKEFSDAVSYCDHLMEEQHQKNSQTGTLTDYSALNSFSFFCTPCDKKFTGNASYEAHLKSKKHGKKLLDIELRKKMSNGCEMNSTESACSEVPTMNSVETMLEFNNEESFVEINSVIKSEDSTITCVCNSKCSGIVSYQQHLSGKKHQKKLRELEIMKQINLNGKMKESETLEKFQQNQNIMCDLKNSTDLNTSLIRKISEACNEEDVDLNNYKYENNDSSCCNVYKQNSLMEKNVMETKEQNLSTEDIRINNESIEKMQIDKDDNAGDTVDFTQNAMDSSNESSQFFSCDICKVQITGAIPYVQHMNGAKHKKEMKKAELLKFHPTFSSGESKSYQQENIPQNSKISLNTDYSTMLTSPILNSYASHSSPDMCKETSLFCKVCNISCSGIIPFEAHITSTKHLKKEAMLQKMHSHTNQFQDLKMQNLNDISSCEGNKVNLSIETKPTKSKLDSSLLFEDCKNDKYSIDGNTANDDDKNAKIENVTCSNNLLFKTKDCQEEFSDNSDYSKCSVAGNMPCSKIIGTAEKSQGSLGNSLLLYNCNICQMSFTGEIPLEQHRNGMKHFKKMQQIQYHEISSTIRNENGNTPESSNRLLQNNIVLDSNSAQHYDVNTQLINCLSSLKTRDSPCVGNKNIPENDSTLSSSESSIVVLDHP